MSVLLYLTAVAVSCVLLGVKLQASGWDPPWWSIPLPVLLPVMIWLLCRRPEARSGEEERGR